MPKVEIIKKLRGTCEWQIKWSTGELIGIIPRQRHEPDDVFEARAIKALLETKKDYKNN